MARESYMDFLKGIAILAVIVGHSVADIANLIVTYNVIYSFHMPLLIYISAYIEEKYRNKYADRMYRMLIKRAITLLIPYLSWTIIYGVASEGALYLCSKSFLNDLLGYTASRLWFLAVLFGLKCMHLGYWYLQSKFNIQNLILDFISVFMLAMIVLLLAICTKHPFIINMLSYAIPYFTGVLIAGKEKIRTFVKQQWVIATSMLTYVAMFQFFSFYNTTWITQVLRIGLSLCVIVVCCNIEDSWKTDNALKKLVCIAGKNSMEIYLLHSFMLDYKEIIMRADSTYLGTALAILFSAGVAIACILLARLLNVSIYCKKILFGK